MVEVRKDIVTYLYLHSNKNYPVTIYEIKEGVGHSWKLVAYEYIFKLIVTTI